MWSRNSSRVLLSYRGVGGLAKLKKCVATGWTQFYEYCGRQYEDFVLTSGSTAKFENTRKRRDAVGSVPKDKVIEDQQGCSGCSDRPMIFHKLYYSLA